MKTTKEIEILLKLKEAALCLEDLNQDNTQLLKDVDSLIALKQAEAISSEPAKDLSMSNFSSKPMEGIPKATRPKKGRYKAGKESLTIIGTEDVPENTLVKKGYGLKEADGFWIEFNHLGEMETSIVVKRDGNEYRQTMDEFIVNAS